MTTDLTTLAERIADRLMTTRKRGEYIKADRLSLWSDKHGDLYKSWDSADVVRLILAELQANERTEP